MGSGKSKDSDCGFAAEQWVCVPAIQRIVTVGLLQSTGFVFRQVKG